LYQESGVVIEIRTTKIYVGITGFIDHLIHIIGKLCEKYRIQSRWNRNLDISYEFSLICSEWIQGYFTVMTGKLCPNFEPFNQHWLCQVCLKTTLNGFNNIFLFLWFESPVGPRLPYCWGFEITLSATLCRTSSDELSARHRDIFTIKHNPNIRQTSVSVEVFESVIPSKRAAADPRL
jgi:hypothetical protein